MFYIHDNIFVCSHGLTRIVDKYVPITHHYRFSIGDFIASVELLSASCQKDANLHVAIGA